jgi:transposase-like protein
MNLFYSNAVGGIKLQVPDHHFRLAHNILNGFEEKESGVSIFPECPVCKSEEVLPKRYNSILLVLSFVLFGGQTLFSTADSRYRCQNCGNIWDMTDDDS